MEKENGGWAVMALNRPPLAMNIVRGGLFEGVPVFNVWVTPEPGDSLD